LIDFTHIVASKTASYDFTNQATHIICNTDLLYFYVTFNSQIYEKFGLNDGF